MLTVQRDLSLYWVQQTVQHAHLVVRLKDQSQSVANAQVDGVKAVLDELNVHSVCLENMLGIRVPVVSNVNQESKPILHV